MEEDTNKTYKKRYDWLKPYQFQKGGEGGPGRPKGKTLKEFAREYLESLPDDRKIEYLAILPEEVVWKMAEGLPQQDITSGGEKLIPTPIINVPTNNSNQQDTETKQEDKDNTGGNISQQNSISTPILNSNGADGQTQDPNEHSVGIIPTP